LKSQQKKIVAKKKIGAIFQRSFYRLGQIPFDTLAAAGDE
jgi:hypothetical protein